MTPPSHIARVLTLALATTLLFAGCSKSNTPQASGPSVGADESVLAHPPTAERANPAVTHDRGEATVIVSDVVVATGVTDVMPLEIRPKGKWKFNPEFPTRVTLSGMASSAPGKTVYKSNQPDTTLQVTAGGMRVDIPFEGQAPGEDRVTAALRFGVCAADTCLIQEHDVAFQVTVTSP